MGDAPVDGYTYMIERNKLLIQKAREQEKAPAQAPEPADTDAQLRQRLMELYGKLQGCARDEGSE